jgi:hypothetical protein
MPAERHAAVDLDYRGAPQPIDDRFLDGATNSAKVPMEVRGATVASGHPRG